MHPGGRTRRRSLRMSGCVWLKKPLAPMSALNARLLKPHPGRSSLPKRKRDAGEGDGGRGPWPKWWLLLFGSSANAHEPQNCWSVTHWWPERQGGFSPSSGLPIAQGFTSARVKKVTEEVAKLNLNRDRTLLLTVGGNDLFLKNGKRGSNCKDLLGTMAG